MGTVTPASQDCLKSSVYSSRQNGPFSVPAACQAVLGTEDVEKTGAMSLPPGEHSPTGETASSPGICPNIEQGTGEAPRKGH